MNLFFLTKKIVYEKINATIWLFFVNKFEKINFKVKKIKL